MQIQKLTEVIKGFYDKNISINSLPTELDCETELDNKCEYWRTCENYNPQSPPCENKGLIFNKNINDACYTRMR